jgi:hypothetical protein
VQYCLSAITAAYYKLHKKLDGISTAVALWRTLEADQLECLGAAEACISSSGMIGSEEGKSKLAVPFSQLRTTQTKTQDSPLMGHHAST